jgi:hypothetical protein
VQCEREGAPWLTRDEIDILDDAPEGGRDVEDAMSETPYPEDDDGLRSRDRARALSLIFKSQGRENLRPTVPTRVEVFRRRTGMIEAWEVIAWLPLTSEFLAWRRDTNNDGRLKAKGFLAEDLMDYDDSPVPLTEEWEFEPVDYEEEAASAESLESDPDANSTISPDLNAGLTLPNSAQLKKYGRREPE